jgi:hypothetical protein
MFSNVEIVEIMNFRLVLFHGSSTFTPYENNNYFTKIQIRGLGLADHFPVNFMVGQMPCGPPSRFLGWTTAYAINPVAPSCGR